MSAHDLLDAGSDHSNSEHGYDSEAAEISRGGRSNKRRKTDTTSNLTKDARFSTTGFSDNELGAGSGSEDGYDSEAAEVSKARTLRKRRKIEQRQSSQQEESQADGEHDGGVDQDFDAVTSEADGRRLDSRSHKEIKTGRSGVRASTEPPSPSYLTKKKPKKKQTPGVIYLSSLPPYLKPSALRNLLSQRGFAPITRLFLTPSTTSRTSKSSRQLYTEGWIEFPSRRVARLCADTLNANIIGGRKGGYYHDDLWNMKYLKGMRWEELMAGVREEKRESEGRRDEERRKVARESKLFLEGVEEGRRVEGIKRKREEQAQRKGGGKVDDADMVKGRRDETEVKRTWRQTEVKRQKRGGGERGVISDDVKAVLGKIF
jgi:ESF2/ABP1 family protein